MPIFRMVPIKPTDSLLDRPDLSLGDLIIELRDEERY
jgi:hypothetical protein